MRLPFIKIFNSIPRGILWLLTILLLAAGVLGFLRLEFKGDIAQIMPTDEQTRDISTASSYVNFLDKIIITVSARDSASPDSLVSFTEAFVRNFQAETDSTLYKEIVYKVPENVIMGSYENVVSNLPLYLRDKDYNKLDSLTSPEAVDEKIKSNLRFLMSPVSVGGKRFIEKDPLGLATPALENLRDFQLDKNYTTYRDYIISEDKKYISLFIVPEYDVSKTEENTFLINALSRSLKTTEKSFPEIKGEYYGGVAVAVANSTRIKKDIHLTVIIGVSILLILIVSYFRNIGTALLIFLPFAIGTGVALLFISFFTSTVSLVMLLIGSVLAGVTIDFAIHVFSHRRSDSAEGTFKTLLSPILTSAITTSSAFLCLLTVRSEAMNQVGVFGSIAVIIAALIALFILPGIAPKGRKKAATSSFIDKAASFPLHKSKILVILVLIITTGAFFFKDKVAFNSDLETGNYLTPELKQAEDNLRTIHSYPYKTIFITSLKQDLDMALRSNEEIEEILDSLKTKGLVEGFSSASTLSFSIDKQKEKIRKWNEYWSDTKKKDLKEAMLVAGSKYGFSNDAYEEFFSLLENDYKPVDPAANPFNQSFLKDFIRFSNDTVAVTTIAKVPAENKPAVYQALSGTEAIAFDKKLLTERFLELLAKDFDQLVSYSLLIVFIILIVSFRNFFVALITFIPLLISWLWTLGIMGLFNLEFNIFNILACTFIFGLGIDYSIFISKAETGRLNTGKNHLNSFKSGILLSALTTVTGIGVLIFAKHPALWSIASIALTGIFSVVVVSFTVQPFLFDFFFFSQQKKGYEPFTFTTLLKNIYGFGLFLGGVGVLLIVSTVFRLIPFGQKKLKLFYHYLVMLVSKMLVYQPYVTGTSIQNKELLNFRSPAVLVSNHQSMIDLPLLLSLNPKIIVLTNEWVAKSPIIGPQVRYADYLNVSSGYENTILKLKELVKDGYSILIFPEGTRSPDQKIKRFHKGAFYIAEELGLDIQPLLIHGAGHFIPKGIIRLFPRKLLIKVFPRISYDSTEFGTSYSEKGKKINRYLRTEYKKIRKERETPEFFQERIRHTFKYLPSGESRLIRSLLSRENYFSVLREQVDSVDKIVIAGAEKGILALILRIFYPEKKIVIYEKDPDKLYAIQRTPLGGAKNIVITGSGEDLSLNGQSVSIINDIFGTYSLNEIEEVKKNLAQSDNILVYTPQLLRGRSLYKNDPGSLLKLYTISQNEEKVTS